MIQEYRNKIGRTITLYPSTDPGIVDVCDNFGWTGERKPIAVALDELARTGYMLVLEREPYPFNDHQDQAS